MSMPQWLHRIVKREFLNLQKWSDILQYGLIVCVRFSMRCCFLSLFIMYDIIFVYKLLKRRLIMCSKIEHYYRLVTILSACVCSSVCLVSKIHVVYMVFCTCIHTRKHQVSHIWYIFVICLFFRQNLSLLLPILRI